jgi:hypothetical protein
LSNFFYEIFEKVLILVGSLLLKGLMVKWGGVLGHFLLWILPVILYLLLLSILFYPVPKSSTYGEGDCKK